MILYTSLFALSALLAALLTHGMRRLAPRVGAIDQPGGDKIHTVATPRLGGVAVVSGGVLALATVLSIGGAFENGPSLAPHVWLPVCVGGAIIFGLGVWDDLHGSTPWLKLGVQALAAVAAIALGVSMERVTLFGTVYELGLLAWPITLLWIVGLTNAFNLIDGLDGLAAGLASIASAACAALCLLRGDAQGALLLVALFGATIGFLPFNFNPARIFLGDSGSLVFGYVLAVLSITRWQKGATVVSIAVPLLIFWLPLADTTFSVLRRSVASQLQSGGAGVSVAGRIRSLKRVLEPDTDHIHHQLLRTGLSHRNAVLLLYGASLCVTIAAVVSEFLLSQ